ncbi:MAG: sigma-70 family RNA polymerase sigma factor [Chloroflexota bacterium]|nr:sigma-70 family RNA polymerase sigma factor [Chloroflexota bacterium]
MALREIVEIEEQDTTEAVVPSAKADAAPGAEDSVAVYLRDIGVIPLLTAAEEVELAKSIELGKEASGRLSEDVTPAERQRIVQQAELGQQARRKMIESNLRLVVSIARRYSGRGLPLSDLIEEGNLGLMRATEKFDHTRGFRFSTYATWWIRQAVTRALASQSRVVRLPVHVSDLISQVSRVTVTLSQELGREPTSEEIAREVDLQPARVREIVKAAQQPVSLEQPYSDGGEGSIADLIEDTSEAQPQDQVSRELLRETVHSALGSLTDREQRVLALRYGLAGDHVYTLEEVGKRLGVTRERIRQIEKEALRKLRQPDYSETLRAFLV